MHTTSLRSGTELRWNECKSQESSDKNRFSKTADDIIKHYFSPGVVVNEAMDIVLFRGNTGNYLQQSPGKPSHNLFKMAKEGLAFELRSILHKTKRIMWR